MLRTVIMLAHHDKLTHAIVRANNNKVAMRVCWHQRVRCDGISLAWRLWATVGALYGRHTGVSRERAVGRERREEISRQSDNGGR